MVSSSSSSKSDVQEKGTRGSGEACHDSCPSKMLNHRARTLTRFFNKQSDLPAPHLPRVRRDIKSRKGHVFELNESSIFEITQHHVEYTNSGTTLKGLAKYDDSQDYGISEDVEKDLLRTEVKQLVQKVTDDNPFLFSSDGLLKSTDSATFDDISNVIDQILSSLDIIKHDNARISLEHCADGKEDVVTDFRRSKQKLISRFKQDSTHVSGCEPKIIDPPEHNQALYFALVDYITACVGRLIVRIASSDYWMNQTMSVLAQWRMKMKILSNNPSHYAQTSLDNGVELVQSLNASFENNKLFFLKIRLAGDEDKDIDTLESETEVSTRYHQEKTFFRREIMWLVKYAARSLLNSKFSSSSAGCFEACTLVYRTGLDGIPTVLSNSRDGEVSASSNSVRVNTSYTALELLHRNAKVIPSDVLPTSNSSAAVEDIRTKIWCEWSDGESGEQHHYKRIETSNMDHVISVTVPLALTTIYAATTMDQLISLAGSGTEEDDPIIQFEPPPRGFQASMTISTSDWIVKQQTLTRGRYHDPEIRPVSSCPMKRGVRAGTSMFMMVSESDDEAVTESRTAKMLEHYKRDKRKMDDWMISEESITIKCKLYVNAIIGVAILIVCGGMSVPFAVGTRIRGVDPFQITTFSWLIVGFIAVLAKSRYVSEWPWHDFLRGQVVCRSIKDVVDVTGINAQMVLVNLLHEERFNILQTKGPYNGMFGRKAEGSSGFAINEPVDLTTMLASGFVILKVLNEFGEHLICLDIRKGSPGEAPEKGQFEKHLACMNIGKDAMYDTLDSTRDEKILTDNAAKDAGRESHLRRLTQEENKVKKLTTVSFRFNRVLGLYVWDSKFG